MTETHTAEAGPMAGKTPALFEHPKPLAIITDDDVRSKFLNAISNEVVKHKPDLSTPKGRDEIASLAYKVARTKTFLDEMGKKLNEGKRQEIGVIDAARRDIRDNLDSLRDDVRKPLNEWEAEEEAKTAAIEETLDVFRRAVVVGSLDTADDLDIRLDRVNGLTVNEDTMGDQYVLALELKREAMGTLAGHITRLKKEEKEREELEELRRKQDETEALAVEAHAKAHEEERLAIAKGQAATDERKRIEDESNAKVEAAEAETERLAGEKAEAEEQAAAEAREQAKRDTDEKHKAHVVHAACKGLMDHARITGTQAANVILAIRAGTIPGVKLTF